jgi:hypothetical protein
MLFSGTLQPWPLAKAIFYENILAMLVCFGGSVAYHTLMAHHQDYHRWLLIDVRTPSPQTSVPVLLVGLTNASHMLSSTDTTDESHSSC